MMQESNNAPRPRIEDVRAVTCAYFGLKNREIIGPCRARRLARPRQIAMVVARMECGVSYPKIGRAFGGRDHTTALHAIRRINRLSETDFEIALHVERVRNRVFEFIAPEGRPRHQQGSASSAIRELTAPYRAIGEFLIQLGRRDQRRAFEQKRASVRELPIRAPIRLKQIGAFL